MYVSLKPCKCGAAKRHVNLSNNLNRVLKCDRRQTDRQTDHAAEKCVAIGEIACIKAILPHNNNNNDYYYYYYHCRIIIIYLV